MQTLNVFYDNLRVGTLTRNDDLIYSFAYDEDWIVHSRAFPVSLALPLSAVTYSNKPTLAFFENLLPEGEVRRTLERHEKIASTFDFLEKFGRDCAGALIITPEAENNADSRSLGIGEEIDLEKIDAAIDQHQSVAEVLAGMDHGYLSLAGAQDKFPAIYKDGKLFIPLGTAPTTHIIKVPIWRSGVKESVANEYYCMELARAVGLTVPHCDMIGRRHPLFIIDRYDREISLEGVVKRLHQQDFCQAQGVPSEQKYEDKGGPSLKDNYRLILTQTPVRSRFKNINLYLDWICFNLIIGNNDSHSKNISLLMRGATNELSPLYDLICTAIYPKLTKQFSFRIGDRSEFSKIGKNQIDLLEDEIEVKRGTFRKRLHNMSEVILENKDRVAEATLEKDSQIKIIHRISDLIDDRIKSLRFQGA
ncbi:MAG: type II toxin-antitoxin system HipA family toxin [Chitinophagaceae bacterium]|nr:type II toxin-antitoxin system HipA family toxin [Oligoflexus sp.]